MKLHYANPISDRTVGKDFRNFGDDLNPWLWDQLLPGVWDDDPSMVFVSIGSQMGSQFANRFKDSHKIVFGTGWGYGDPIGAIDDSWTVYCVRGPITAESMGLPKSDAITDAAALIRTVHTPPSDRPYPRSYMPHCASANENWQAICESLGLHYIDPRNPMLQVLKEIGQSEVLYTEALHGAIVADTLRVPWMPFVTTRNISSLKWNDWCATVGIDYKPTKLPGVWAAKDPTGQLRTYLKAKSAAFSLRRALRHGKPNLSDDQKLNDLVDQLLVRLDRLKNDLASENIKA